MSIGSIHSFSATWGPFPYGSSQGSFHAPAESEPSAKGGWFETKLLFPLRHILIHAVKGQKAGASPVVILCSPRNPFTVVWLVTLVVVNSLYGVTERAWTHIGEESSKFFPAIAQGDAASTVPFEHPAIWVKAPFLDPVPNVVFFGFRSSMKECSFARVLVSLAPTTGRVSGSNQASIDGLFCSAGAKAHPEPVFLITSFPGSPAKNRQPSESLPGHIYKG